MSNAPAVWKAIQVPYESVMSKSEEVICVGLTEQQIAALLSQTAYLHWPTRWFSDTPFTDEQIAVIKRLAQETEAALLTACGETACYDLPPSSSMVTWEPQNPYTDPSLVPDGYADVPFTVVKSSDVGLLALGLAVGDVMTDITRFPTGSLPTIIPSGGFARFRITFTGNEIELHLLQIPLGGMATISVDGDVTSLQTIDLSKDIFSLPVETISVITHQIKFAAIDEHYVDVTFVPWVNDELPFLTYGGGIRAFTVCGEYQDVFDVRQNPDLPCKLEKSLDNGETWTEFADLQKCPPRLRRNPGTGAWQLSDDGLTWFDVAEGPWTEDLFDPPPSPAPRPRYESGGASQRCAAAANAENVLHATFNGTADYLSPTNNTATDVALGVGGIIAALLFLPVVGWLFLVPIIGGIIAASIVFNRSDYDSEVAERLRCILYCNAEVDGGGVVTFNFAGVKDDISGESGNPWPALSYILDMITPDGLNTAGGTTAVDDTSCYCPECDDVWCYVFDFALGNGGFTVRQYANPTAFQGTYSAGAWRGEYAQGTDFVRHRVAIGHSMPANTVVTKLRVEFDYTLGYFDAQDPGFWWRFSAQMGGETIILHDDASWVPTGVEEWEGELETNDLSLQISTGGAARSYSGTISGSSAIHKITLWGRGTNPFGEDNCS